MIKIKAADFLQDTVYFGLAALLLLTASLVAAFGGISWKIAVDIMLVAIIVLNVAICRSLISNIRRDFAMLVFVVAFDLLLFGRVYVSWIGYSHKLLLLLETDSYEKLLLALQIVTISLLSVYAAYRLAGPIFFKRETAVLERGMEAVRQDRLLPIIRQISKLVLYVSSIAFFYILLKSGLAVLRNGYLSSFTNTTDIPGYISRLSMFFVPAFAVFLATLPNKKQIRIPLAVYFVYMLASVLTGRRTTLVTEALMLIVYFVLRDSLLKKEERVLKTRTVLCAGIVGLVGIYLLQLLALIRSGNTDLNRGFGKMLVSFIDSQGASFRVVMQTVNHIDLFPAGVSSSYLFYPFELFAHNNVVIRTLFGLKPIIEVQNSAFVQTTHNFAHALTYMVDPDRYLSGGGFGTSYIAEAYTAYRMVGAILVSAMIGVIFRFFSSMLTRSWVVIACGLLAVKNFIYIPRSFGFLWVTEVFNITYLCFYIAIYLAALLVYRLGTHVRPAENEPPAEAGEFV